MIDHITCTRLVLQSSVACICNESQNNCINDVYKPVGHKVYVFVLVFFRMERSEVKWDSKGEGNK